MLKKYGVFTLYTILACWNLGNVLIRLPFFDSLSGINLAVGTFLLAIAFSEWQHARYGGRLYR